MKLKFILSAEVGWKTERDRVIKKIEDTCTSVHRLLRQHVQHAPTCDGVKPPLNTRRKDREYIVPRIAISARSQTRSELTVSQDAPMVDESTKVAGTMSTSSLGTSVENWT